MTKSSQIGASFEQQTADYLAHVLGRSIERRVKHGAKDRGDIAGLYIRGQRTVVECKCCKRMELAQWIDEADEERANDDADFGIVIHKRKGCGKKNFGGNYVTMTLETLAAIIAGCKDFLNEND